MPRSPSSLRFHLSDELRVVERLEYTRELNHLRNADNTIDAIIERHVKSTSDGWRPESDF
jgi:hypothetical protein